MAASSVSAMASVCTDAPKRWINTSESATWKCPSSYGVKYGCCRHDFRDAQLATCDGKVRSITSIAELLRGKTISLVGDSVMDQQYLEWSYELTDQSDAAHAHEVLKTAALSKFARAEHLCAMLKAQLPDKSTHFPRWNITLNFYMFEYEYIWWLWSGPLASKSARAQQCNSSWHTWHKSAQPRFLDGPYEDSFFNSTHPPPVKDVNLGRLENVLRNTDDVVIASCGVHWNLCDWNSSSCNGSHYQRAVRSVLQMVAERDARRGSAAAFYRMVLPQHFINQDRTGDWQGVRGQCQKNHAKSWRTRIEEQLMGELRFASRLVVNQHGMLMDRPDAHHFASPRLIGDCTHYCFAPNFAAGLYDPTVRVLQNELVRRLY